MQAASSPPRPDRHEPPTPAPSLHRQPQPHTPHTPHHHHQRDAQSFNWTDLVVKHVGREVVHAVLPELAGEHGARARPVPVRVRHGSSSSVRVCRSMGWVQGLEKAMSLMVLGMYARHLFWPITQPFSRKWPCVCAIIPSPFARRRPSSVVGRLGVWLGGCQQRPAERSGNRSTRRAQHHPATHPTSTRKQWGQRERAASLLACLLWVVALGRRPFRPAIAEARPQACVVGKNAEESAGPSRAMAPMPPLLLTDRRRRLPSRHGVVVS